MQKFEKLCFFSLITMALLFFTACPGPGSSNSNETGAENQTAVSSDGAINLTTFRYLVQDQELLQDYEQRANKRVNVQLKRGAELLEMAKNGKLANQDVVLVDNFYHLHQLIKMGVLDPFHVGIFDNQVPSRYVDSEGYWSAVSRWTMSFVFRYPEVDQVQMKKYAGVLDPKYKGRVVMSHPDSSGLVTMIGYMIGIHGEEAANVYLRSLASNLAEVPQGNDYQQVQKVIDGKADIAIVSGSAYLRYRHSGNPEIYKATNDLIVEVPLDAKGNNYYDISGIGIVKNAKNRAYALPMVEFLSIVESQELFAHAMMEYPVNVYAPELDFLMDIDGLPQGQYSPETAENQLDRARELIREVLGL